MANPDKNVEQHEVSDTAGENQIIRFTHFVFFFNWKEVDIQYHVSFK